MSINPQPSPRYVYALGARWLNRFFDPLLGVTLRHTRFKAALLDQAHVVSGQRVLDLGCGTGTLLPMLQRRSTGIGAVGLDGDEAILTLAAAKGRDRRAAQRIKLVAALGEGFRVLRPGGELHVADWGEPHTRLMRIFLERRASVRGSRDDRRPFRRAPARVQPRG